MAEIIMPKMGDAMTEGKVVRWYKKAGDAVRKGEPVLEIETDKVNLDLEAEEDGFLGGVEVEAGAIAPVGAVLAVVSADGSAPAAKSAKPAAEATPEKPAEKLPAEAAAPGTKPAPERGAGERVKSSPLARRMAKDFGVDIARVAGSGPGGRIVARDVEEARAGAPARSMASGRRATLQTRDVPLTAMRRTIAKRLSESIGPIPHFFLTVDLDVTQLMAVRGQINEIEETKVSVNDFVVRAAALSLLEHPNVNASFLGESIREHGDVHIGIAVATPEGLLTPVVRNADTLSVVEIASTVRDLAERARNRKLMPDEYQGATFTISNLGMFGIEEFTAIINPPNAAILAVGAASQQAVVVDGNIVIRDRMRVTMSCDHRVVDGAAGAQYLQSLRKYIEQPLRLVM